MSDWTRSASKLLWPPAGIQPLRAPVSSWVKSEPHFGVEKFYVDIKCPTSERSFIQTGSQRETEFNSTGCNEGILMNYLEGCGQLSGDDVQVPKPGHRRGKGKGEDVLWPLPRESWIQPLLGCRWGAEREPQPFSPPHIPSVSKWSDPAHGWLAWGAPGWGCCLQGLHPPP